MTVNYLLLSVIIQGKRIFKVGADQGNVSYLCLKCVRSSDTFLLSVQLKWGKKFV